MTIKWSERLVDETRSALTELTVVPQSTLHMKNADGGYGKIRLEDLVVGRLFIQDKKSDAVFMFTSVDELISAGWAID